MKLFDNIKDFFFASDEDEDGVSETPSVSSVPVMPSAAPAPAPVSVPVQSDSRSERAAASAAAYNSSNQSTTSVPFSDYDEPSADKPRRNKVVNIQTTAQLQVVLVKPSAFTDAKQIADHLIERKTVVLNLETASPENKRRIIDFLVGVAYANGGSLKPVANLTYIITPYNVGFIGEDLVGELENNGVFI